MAYRPDSNGCGITKKRKRNSDQVISELDHDEMDIDSSTAPTVENPESFKGGVSRDKAVPFDVNTIVAGQADAHLVHETAPAFEFFSNKVTFTHNFSRTTPQGFGLIPNPSLPQTISHGDSLTVISEKLRKLINYGLQTGRSLAMATDFLTVDQLKELDPIGNAIASLDFRERDFWDAYCNAVHGITDDIQAGSLDLITKVPVPDWSEPEVQLPIADPKSPARKSFERRALALKFLYKTPQTVTAENGRWFTMTHVNFLPLVKAVDRLHAGIKLQKCTRERAKVHMLNKEISFLKSVIQSVELILHRRIMGLASSRLSSYDPSSDAKRRKFSSAFSTHGSISTISTSGTSTNVAVAENNVTYDQPATKANIRHCLSVLRERVKELEAENVKVCVEVNSYIRRPWTERQNDVLKQLKVFSGRNADDDGMYAD